jgi:hypothetical protein
MRHAFSARLNENELMGAQSCLVGPNRLTPNGQDFVGKSGLFAPIPLSPRHDGILYEVGAMTVEGIIAETLDLGVMRQQWTDETPRLRQGMRVLAYQPLGDAYHELHTLDQAYHTPEVVPDTWTIEAPEELPPVPVEEEEPPMPPLPVPDADAEVDLDVEAEADLDSEVDLETEADLDVEADAEARNLNLRGEDDSDDSFDLLASPFSLDDTEQQEED